MLARSRVSPQPRSRGAVSCVTCKEVAMAQRKQKAPSLQQRDFRAVQSGQLVRTPGTPAATMSDFELTRFLVEHTPDYDIEYYLMMADRGG